MIEPASRGEAQVPFGATQTGRGPSCDYQAPASRI